MKFYLLTALLFTTSAIATEYSPLAVDAAPIQHSTTETTQPSVVPIPGSLPQTDKISPLQRLDAKSLKSQTSVDISGQALTDESFQKNVLPLLKKMPKLDFLDLSNNPGLMNMEQIAKELAPLKTIKVIEPAKLMARVQDLRKQKPTTSKKPKRKETPIVVQTPQPVYNPQPVFVPQPVYTSPPPAVIYEPWPLWRHHYGHYGRWHR